MNKLLLTTLGMVAAVSAAYAQGTFNANNNFTPAGASAKAFVLDPNGSPLAKANGRVEILSGGTSLSPNGSAGVALTLDGLFFINGLVAPGAGLGGTANLVVRAWDVTTGATYDAATARGSVNVVISSLGGGTTPPATFGNNSDFKGLKLESAIIPEPSTVALAALGVAGLFVMARRKSCFGKFSRPPWKQGGFFLPRLQS